MKLSYLLYVILLLGFVAADAQDMDNQKLHSIIYTVSDEVEGKEGNWQFVIDSTIFLCLTDETHNRMRIISPIVRVAELTEIQMEKCMEANFHTALDSKYAISDDILWAVFIHPLKELTKDQVLSAIGQVYSTAKTFGSTYSSGALSFPAKEKPLKEEKKIKRS